LGAVVPEAGQFYKIGQSQGQPMVVNC